MDNESDKKICCCCNKICGGRSTPNRFICVKNKLPHRSVSASDALKKIYKIKINVDQVICLTCAQKLGTAENSISKFEEVIDNASKLKEILTTSPSRTENEQQISVTPTRSSATGKMAKTPVRKKIKKFMNNTRKQSTFLNQVAGLLDKEIIEYSRHTVLKNKILEESDIFPKTSVVLAEMKMYCPFFLRMLQTLMLKRYNKNTLTLSMRTVIAVIMKSRWRNACVFQKGVGLAFFYGRLNMKTYKVMNQLGICCSYRTVIRTLDILIKNYDREIKLYKQDTSRLLKSNRSQDDEMIVADDDETHNHPNSQIPNNPTPSTPRSKGSLMSGRKLFLDDTLSESEHGSDYEMIVADDDETLNHPKSQIPHNPIPSTPRRKGLMSRRKLFFDDTLSESEDVSDYEDISEEEVAEETEDQDRGRINTVPSKHMSEKLFYGATFVTDNIDHQPQSLHLHSKTSKTELHMTSTAFIRNRIPQVLDDVFQSPKYRKAKDVPMSAYIPTEKERNRIKEDHRIEIRRILVKCLPFFESIQNHESIQWRIPHKYSNYAGMKSKVVNMGVEDINEGTKDGIIQLLEYIEGYIPDRDGKKMSVVVNGDGKTCDFIRSAKFHRFNADVNAEKLEGPVIGVGPFHERMTILVDVMKLFFGDKKGSPGPGTLPWLAAVFGHNEKMTDAKHNFHLATRFCDFALVVYIVSKTMDILGMQDYEDKKNHINEIVKLRMLDKAVCGIMEMQWVDLDRNKLQEKFCFCDAVYDAKEGRDFIACDNNLCKREVWYHQDCLIENQNYLNPPKDPENQEYYCCAECKSLGEDKVYTYTKSFINAWLNFVMYRDAIRHMDGDRQNAYTKLHLIQFFNSCPVESRKWKEKLKQSKQTKGRKPGRKPGPSHPNYLRIGHLWQAQKEGFADRNVQFDLLYNCSVNMTGKPNGNIDCDLFQEFMNRSLKSMILMQYGVKNKKAVIRRSKSVHILAEVMSSWDELIGSIDSCPEHHARYDKWMADVKEAVTLTRNLKVLEIKGKRCFPGFPGFTYNHVILDDVVEYKKTIEDLADKVDFAQECRDEIRDSTSALEV